MTCIQNSSNKKVLQFVLPYLQWLDKQPEVRVRLEFLAAGLVRGLFLPVICSN